MGSDVIIFRWPDIDCHLRLFDAVEPLGIEDFSAQRAVEPFVVAILPGDKTTGVFAFLKY